MAWRRHERSPLRRVVVGVLVTMAVGSAIVACSRQPEIGSQADLDSLVSSAGSVRPIDTLPDTDPAAIDPLGTDPLGTDPFGGGAGGGSGGSSGAGGSGTGAGAAGGRGSSAGGAGGSGGAGSAGGSGGASGSTPSTAAQPPIVVDTSPDHPTSAFCLTLGGLLDHLATPDLQRGARDFLDDGDQVRQLQSQAPDDGTVPVSQLLQAVQNLANGSPITSPLVTVPLLQFNDWVKHTCEIVR